MSREWSRHSFRAVAPAETSFAQVAETGTGPIGFVKQEPVTWRNADGFVRKGEGFAPASGFEAPKRPTIVQGSDFVPSTAFGGAPEPVQDIEPEIVEPEIEMVEGVIEPEPECPPDAQASADAFAAGFAEGERTAHAMVAGEAAACARLIVALNGSMRFDRAGLAQRMQQTVLHLVKQLVGEIGVTPERLAQRVENAVSMLADLTEPARVFLHPADLELIGAHLPSHVSAVASPQIERGGFRMETISATIEDGPTLWLEQLSEALDRLPTVA